MAKCMENLWQNVWKIYGKIYGKSTPKSMADSMAIPRLISEAKSQKSLEILTDDSILISVFLVRVYQKVRFLMGIWTIWGAYGSGGWLGAWLAGE